MKKTIALLMVLCLTLFAAFASVAETLPETETIPENVEQPQAEPESEPESELQDEFKLTILYVDLVGEPLPVSDELPVNPVELTIAAGTEYVVELPVLTGLVCQLKDYTIVMPNQDETVLVGYDPIAEMLIQYEDEVLVLPEDLDTEGTDEELIEEPIEEPVEEPVVEKVALDNHADELPEQDENPYVLIVCEEGGETILGQKLVMKAELHNFGETAVNYQWQRRNGEAWEDVAGATSDTYEIESLTREAFGDWRVLVSIVEE